MIPIKTNSTLAKISDAKRINLKWHTNILKCVTTLKEQNRPGQRQGENKGPDEIHRAFHKAVQGKSETPVSTTKSESQLELQGSLLDEKLMTGRNNELFASILLKKTRKSLSHLALGQTNQRY